jgi:hypothetical protein
MRSRIGRVTVHALKTEQDSTIVIGYRRWHSIRSCDSLPSAVRQRIMDAVPAFAIAQGLGKHSRTADSRSSGMQQRHRCLARQALVPAVRPMHAQPNAIRVQVMSGSI